MLAALAIHDGLLSATVAGRSLHDSSYAMASP
jgi:hypothetical protein